MRPLSLRVLPEEQINFYEGKLHAGMFTPTNNPCANVPMFSGSSLENAFSYNYENKMYGDKRKIRKSREEVDQTLFTIDLNNVIYD